MTPAQYLAAIKRLGFDSPTEAARSLGLDGRTSRRWASEGGMPEIAAILLRLAVAGKITISDIEGAK